MTTVTTVTTDVREHPTRARVLLNLVLVVLVAAALAWAALSLRGGPAAAAKPGAAPQSSAMEKATGVRFSRVAVVGDGGLVTVFYVVLDPEKATQFQSDRDHPPMISSDDRKGGTQRASIMRAGHQMRAGQTYYLVYQNTRGAIRAGEHVSITYGGHSLHRVPVL